MKKSAFLMAALASLFSVSLVYADAIINTQLSTSLPAQMIVGQTYKVGFTLTNVTSSSIILNRIYADPTQPLPQGVTVTTNTCTDNLPLAPNQSCYWAANYIPQESISATPSITLYMDHSPFAKHVLVGSTSGAASYALVSAQVQESVPAQSIEGLSYPIKVAFTNQSANTVASIPLTPFMPMGMTQISDGCASSVAAGASCIWQAEFIPSIANTTYNFSIGYTSDNVKQNIQLPQSYTTQGGFQVAITRTFPKETYVGSRYSLEYKLTNYSGEALTVSSVSTSAQTGLVPWPTSASPTASGVDTCSGQTIAAGATCNWGADFTIAEPTAYTLIPQLQLANTAEPEVLPSVSTTAIPSDVTSQIKLGTELKNPTLIGQTYTTSYIVSNTTDEPITLLGISGIDSDFSMASTSTCSTTVGSNSIQAGQSCQLDVSFVPQTLGTAALAPLFSLALADKQQIDHVLQNQMTKAVYPTVAVEVTGTKLPEKTVVNHAYSIQYTVTNNSTASQTISAITDVPSDLDNIVDNCTGKTLGTAVDNKTCTWSANFTPVEAGSYVIQPTLALAAGNNVVFPSQSTTAASEKLSVTISTSLPSTLTMGADYEGITVYTLTNNSGSTLELKSLVSGWSPPTGFAWSTTVPNVCVVNTPLANNSSCVLSADYTPPTTGLVTLSPVITFDDDTTEALPVQKTTVSIGRINSKVVDAIPSTMSIAAKEVYHARYGFINKMGNSTITKLSISGIPNQLVVTPTSSSKACIGLPSDETCDYNFDVSLASGAAPIMLKYIVHGNITTKDNTSGITTDHAVTITHNTLTITQ